MGSTSETAVQTPVRGVVSGSPREDGSAGGLMSTLRHWLVEVWHEHVSGPLDRMYEHVDRPEDDDRD